MSKEINRMNRIHPMNENYERDICLPCGLLAQSQH
jgi:hypothetical protein